MLIGGQFRAIAPKTDNDKILAVSEISGKSHRTATNTVVALTEHKRNMLMDRKNVTTSTL